MTETVFSKVDYTLGSLMDAIELGIIGLPDIQRPFVWKNSKVRNLFNSMYRGYPVGYLLFWENASADRTRDIGANHKQRIPNLLIVDGQQRLTSLYAVIKGLPVVRENYQSEHIEIAFSPLTETFEVADAASRRDKAYIPNISTIWARNTDLFELAESYLEGLAMTREVSPEERRRVRKAITRIQNLTGFPFTSLSLSSSIDEEQVAEVFVLINSEGKKLNQADFILTLMSVFWDEGRSQLEEFCRQARLPAIGKPSPFNHFIEPGPDQLLRVSVGVGFRRARLKSVYSILRGKDLETDTFEPGRRDAQFQILKNAQSRAINLQYWHDFLKSLLLAGFRSGRMISSQTNLLFAYILYLLGRTEYRVDEFELQRHIARWFFMTALTGRYTSSPESRMEFDLARFRETTSADAFISVLTDICESTLTSDYWSITLPGDLATAAARSPSMFAYFAALNLLDAKALFSKQKVADLMDPATTAIRASLERHHLFPKDYLKSIGVSNNRDINQIANFTVVEWGDNFKISNKAPAEYLSKLQERFSKAELEKMRYWHALPKGWESLEYPVFLRSRRELMARVIHDAYELLSGKVVAEGKPREISIADLVRQGETMATEFKSALRKNLHTNAPDPRIELGILRTIAGFVNTDGGTLVIGVADDGSPVGIEVDDFPNEDKMYLHLVNLIKDRMGPQHAMYISPHFGDFEGARVLMVECKRGRAPVYVKDGNIERFYVRLGPSTNELSASQIQEFIKHRFGH